MPIATPTPEQPPATDLKQGSKAPNNRPWTPPPSLWTATCHPLVDEISQQVDDYFLQHWDFPNDRARAIFKKAQFSRVTCLYFPRARDDRIHLACRLLTVLFLIDDLLEDMTLDAGREFNEHLMQFCRGDVRPDDQPTCFPPTCPDPKPAEYILFNLWAEMRIHDRELADGILEPTFIFMRSQTSKSRIGMRGLGNYLTYRESDVGKALLSALMQFTMDIRLSPEEVEVLKPVEQNCARHVSVVNDIHSWEKEHRASKTRNAEGAVLCSAVNVLSEEANLDVDATKRVLQVMVREWEAVHLRLEAMLLKRGVRQCVKDYVKGLEYQMSGNEHWSMSTLRYHELD